MRLRFLSGVCPKTVAGRLPGRSGGGCLVAEGARYDARAKRARIGSLGIPQACLAPLFWC
jgi:hypothetical protein